MGIYKNDYSKEEDHSLLEIHEIRHSLHKEIKNKTVEQINKDALTKYKSWLHKNTCKKAAIS